MRIYQIFIMAILCCFVHTEIVELQQSETNFCPQSYFSWKIDEEMYSRNCKNGTKYHCLETQRNKYIKLCATPLKIQAGKYPLYSEVGGIIYSYECSRETYQPVMMMSNKFFSAKCEKKKSLCNQLGEFSCDDGSYVEDRKCGCNYTAGYAIQQVYENNPQNLTCFKPKVMHADCKYLPCMKPEKEMNPAYYCVPKCKPGFYRPWRQFNCIKSRSYTEFSTKSVKDTSTMTTAPPTFVITAALTPISDNPSKGSPAKSGNEENRIYIPVTVICIIFVIAMIVFCVVYSRKQGTSHNSNLICIHCGDGCCNPKTNITGHNIVLGESNTFAEVVNTDREQIDNRGIDYQGDHKAPLQANVCQPILNEHQPVVCHEDLLQKEIRESLEKLENRIIPEFQIVRTNTLQPKSHDLYFSLHFLLQTYYKEKICSVRNVFEFHKKICLSFAQKYSYEYASVDLDGYAQRKPEDKSFGGEFTLKEVSELYDVPVVVLLLKKDSSELKRLSYNLGTTEQESSKVKPVLYVGCLHISNQPEEYFFVPLQSKDTEIDGGITTSITQIEESLNKSEDDNGYYMVHQNLLRADVHESIAFINFSLNDSTDTGTGYRVGSKYLITALHVIIRLYGYMWQIIFQTLEEDVKEIMEDAYTVTIHKEAVEGNQIDLPKCFKDGLPVSLQVNTLIEYLRRNGLETKANGIDEAVAACENLIEVKFGWTHTSECDKKFKLSLNIPYANYDKDIAILQIKVPGDQENKLPKRLLLYQKEFPNFDSVHILGHPSGKSLQFDPNCKVVCRDEELDRIKDKARNYFTSGIKPPLQKDYKEKVCTEYRDLKIKQGFILMHCSFTFDKGTSGGPCLIYDKDLNAPVVVGTIQKGMPWIYFNLFNESQKKDSRKEFEIFLERGLLSSKLLKVMTIEKCQSYLLKDIFNETRDQDTVLAAKIQAPGGPVVFSKVRKDSVTLQWNKAQADVCISSYHIEKAEVVDECPQVLMWERYGEVLVTDEGKEKYELEVTDLTPSKKYVFKIHAEGVDKQHGLFLQSDDIIAQDKKAPPEPKGPLIIKAIDKESVLLSWKQIAPSTEFQDLEYHIQVCKDDGDWVNKAMVTGCTETTMHQINPNCSYHFQVYAQNADGKSSPLKCTGNLQIKDLFLPPAISSKPEAVVQGLRVELKWTAICDVIYPVTEYEIHYDNNLFIQKNESQTGGDIIYRTCDLTIGKQYKFSICAKNDIGCGPEVETDCVVIKGTPERPTGPLKCSLTEGSDIHLQWLPSPSDGGSPVLVYFVENYEDGQWGEIDKTKSDRHSIVYSNTERGKSYRFRVYAENENGQSDYLETEQDIKIPCACPQAPSRSTEPVLCNGSVTLHWGYPADDGGSPITSYKIYQKQEGTRNSSASNDEERSLLEECKLVFTCGPDKLSHVIENLPLDEPCCFKIVAVNEVGNGDALEFQPVVAPNEGFASKILKWFGSWR